MPPQLQSPEITAFANGFPAAMLHFGITLLILILGVALYVLLTPHKEVQLIREGNSAAAVSLAGIMLGLGIPLAVSLHVSKTPLDVAIWGASSIIIQLLVFCVVDLVLQGLPQRIKEGEISAAALLVGAKLSTALILAAAMAG